MTQEKIIRLLSGLFWLCAGMIAAQLVVKGFSRCYGSQPKTETAAAIWQPPETAKPFRWQSNVDSITNSEKDTMFFDMKDSTFYGNALLGIQYTSIAGTPNIEVMCYEWGYQEKEWIQGMHTLKTRSGKLKTSHHVYGGRHKIVVSGSGTQKAGYRVIFTAQRK